jgi:hypothetical protein
MKKKKGKGYGKRRDENGKSNPGIGKESRRGKAEASQGERGSVGRREAGKSLGNDRRNHGVLQRDESKRGGIARRRKRSDRKSEQALRRSAQRREAKAVKTFTEAYRSGDFVKIIVDSRPRVIYDHAVVPIPGIVLWMHDGPEGLQ